MQMVTQDLYAEPSSTTNSYIVVTEPSTQFQEMQEMKQGLTPTMTTAPSQELFSAQQQVNLDNTHPLYTTQAQIPEQQQIGTDFIHPVLQQEKVPTPLDQRENLISKENVIDKIIDNPTLEPINDSEHLKSVSVGDKGIVYGLTKGGHIHKLNTESSPFVWQFVHTGKIGFKAISVGKGDSLYAIGLLDSLLYQLNSKTNLVERLEIEENYEISQISAVDSKSVYAVTESGVCVKLKHPKWTRKNAGIIWKVISSPPLRRISVSGRKIFNSEVWGICTLDNRAMRKEPNLADWVPFEEQLLDITVTRDNAVYGIRLSDNAIVQWDHHGRFQPVSMSGCENALLSSISAFRENDHIFAVNANDGNIVRLGKN
ncbi:hypothetical protein AKO1_008182 [Acrasis kona]|uniref:Uncharacterized protein n=1 Tax=Acrasis kona TaxID=1008807 RepID=A0AAW2YN36_9EUKA